MNKLIAIFLLCFLFASTSLSAQTEGSLTIAQDTTKVPVNDDIDPLTPAKAAFYSALVPGLGQFYNKRYWKIPLVLGAIGGSVYSYSWNNTKYHEFRDVYRRRLAGFTDDNYRFLSEDRLISAQRFYQKNRDLSILVGAAFYILNIVDANVDAHLKQFNVDDKLTINPDLFNDDIYQQPNIGITLNYRF